MRSPTGLMDRKTLTSFHRCPSDYPLRGRGWAVAVIGDENAQISVPASYLCDALRDFVDAVQSIAGSNSVCDMWLASVSL